jgi:hypothetical protein
MTAGGHGSLHFCVGVSGVNWRGVPGALCLVVAGFLAGCSGGGGGSTPPTANPAVTISGALQARLGTTVQLTATVTNASNPAVNWQVNGVPGGSAATGTISTTGLYTAPSTIPSPNTVSITAVTQATPAATSAPIAESILNPLPVVSAATTAQTASANSYNLVVNGSGFVSTSQIQAAGNAVTTAYISPTQLSATVTLAANTTSVTIAVTNPDPGGSTSPAMQTTVAKTSLPAAARLLDQATFGPTLSDIEHVEQVGINAYLTEQFAMPTTLLPDIAATPPTPCVNTLLPCEQSEWWQTMLTAPDQLRQRVAFALASMFVVSTNSVNARSVTTYQNTLANDAFTNFYTIMQDVSLSPAMGGYLNMLNSAKPATGQIANENYARELMQLFTTGLYLLNQDGSLQVDGSGNPIPVYTEAQVQAFARAFTGWTYANASGTGTPAKFPNPANYTIPMAAVDSQHDPTAKILLDGTTLPAAQSTTQDLTGR